MSIQKAMNDKYGQLCQALGAITVRQAALNAEADAIKAKITALNELAPTMNKIETDFKASQHTAEAVKYAE